MKVKLKDIATKTGVSLTTVSMVLNDKPISISDQTRRLILQTAKEMGYPRHQKVKNIGLLIPDLSNMYYSELTKGISIAAQEEGYNLIIFDSNNKWERDVNNLLTLQQTEVEGIIIAFSVGRNINDKTRQVIKQMLEDNQTTIVLIDRNDPAYNCHSVCVNHFQGAYLATKHLIELGHTRIGCITGGAHLSVSQDRLRGYIAAFEEHDLPYEESWIVHGEFRMESGYALAKELLEQKVTAIFAQNDMIAFGVYNYLREIGLSIPKDISLVGFDDVPFASMLDVPLTTVSQMIQDMGRRAIDVLLTRRGMTDNSDRVHLILQPELVIRKSTKRYDPE
jgi:LacI family transcriptional regulator